MQSGLLNVVIDSAWGSSGKGKVCDWLCATRNVTDVIASNMPNAGHTVVRDNKKCIMKVLPSGAPFNDVHVWLGPGTGFNHDQLIMESAWLDNRVIRIHDRAFEVDRIHAHAEAEMLSSISSTMQGSGVALSNKILRQKGATLSNSKIEIPSNVVVYPAAEWRKDLMAAVVNGRALYEISQGWGLSIDHGTHYPHCTSRNCSVGQAVDNCSIPPFAVGDVIAVVRPYPIRVGNTSNGYSGDFMADNTEVTWEHVAKVSGLAENLRDKELTTVTKRVRRVSTFSFELLRDCVKHNGVTGLFLNFAQYIDASVAGKRGHISQAPKSVRIFMDALEVANNIPVIGVGTGADTFDVLEP